MWSGEGELMGIQIDSRQRFYACLRLFLVQLLDVVVISMITHVVL